ncbi:BZ3500_MvSof-1268-A1-R1_Chr1-3g01808 [Microbotryum saponariae]|uniref:BZ3500_MvSof-1268-A1-R1_Chr1-3g01808 protein n=1 Tax=Microbotryum saponariae TaxID=289078 RepID=A0A2X0L730_9BASI|nr:BZ3500_MvSof-1268-A1-R1_Chr1-3g01808 [Microbotryum saponariae]SCZ94631.1 BZ3501_MvSof-1269-A2-R1_Chr1-3g01410 [Microbotryum saponariae]
MPFPVTIDSSITVPRSQSKHRRSALRQAPATSGTLSATDGAEDLDRCAAVGTSSRLVELNDDLWLHILENIPARELTRLRTVSHDFCAKISHLLRARFRHLACSKQYEVLFESCAPAATRRSLRHRVTFSSFVSNDPSSIELAEFGFTGSTTASQSITLDDDQSFGNNILALHIRTVHASAKTPLHLEAPETWRAASSPPTLESYAWTMTVANGMNRVFRSWFERPDIPPPSPPSSPEYDSSDQETLLAPRPKAIKMLKPALGCAIHSAQIQCHLVHGIARDPRVTYQPLPGALPSRFEFAYESLKVDVARLVVGVEEGIRRSGHKERFLMWLRV